MFAVNAFLS